MNFAQLLYFVEVAKTSSLNKAAKNLYITPSALSFALDSLEKELGTNLLQRTRSGSTLTASGQNFLIDALTILSMQKGWINLNNPSVVNEKISIAVVPAIYHSIWGDILYSSPLSPDYYIETLEYNTAEIHDALLAKKLSYAITGVYPLEYSMIQLLCDTLNLNLVWLFPDSLDIWINQKHPLSQKHVITLEDLKPYKVIKHFSESVFKYNYYKLFDSFEPIFIDNYLHQIQYIQQSERFSFCGHIMSHSIYIQNSSVITVPLDIGINNEAIYWCLIYPKENVSERTQTFIDTIIQMCKKYKKCLQK